MTLAWVEAEIEKAEQGGNNAKNVYDLAALLIVRDHLRAATSPKAVPVQEDRAKRDAIVLTSHSADLDVVPTIAQVEEALGAVIVSTPEERQRVQDAKTWAQIIRDKK